MKQVLSYMLLIVYTTLLVKPVLPFFIDAAQHIFNYQDHMTVVHVENGQYHVHHELNENTKKNTPHKDAANSKKNISQDEYIFQNELKNYFGNQPYINTFFDTFGQSVERPSYQRLSSSKSIS